MPSADQVPNSLAHSTMRWGQRVILTTGSTGSALRAVRPPNLHITPDGRCNSSRGKYSGFFVVLAASHYRPCHAGDLVGECNGGDLCWPPLQQCGEPGPTFGPMVLGMADDGERAGHKQAA